VGLQDDAAGVIEHEGGRGGDGVEGPVFDQHVHDLLKRTA